MASNYDYDDDDDEQEDHANFILARMISDSLDDESFTAHVDHDNSSGGEGCFGTLETIEAVLARKKYDIVARLLALDMGDHLDDYMPECMALILQHFRIPGSDLNVCADLMSILLVCGFDPKVHGPVGFWNNNEEAKSRMTVFEEMIVSMSKPLHAYNLGAKIGENLGLLDAYHQGWNVENDVISISVCNRVVCLFGNRSIRLSDVVQFMVAIAVSIDANELPAAAMPANYAALFSTMVFSARLKLVTTLPSFSRAELNKGLEYAYIEKMAEETEFMRYKYRNVGVTEMEPGSSLSSSSNKTRVLVDVKLSSMHIAGGFLCRFFYYFEILETLIVYV